MNKIAEVLKETGVFYIATAEGDQPRTRPFGAVIEFNGKAYFCTNNTKNVYRQLMENPKTEICGSLPSGKWVRVTGTLVRDDNDDVRAAMLEEIPSLKNMYHIGDGIFEVLYLDNASAVVYSTDAAPEVIKG